jgi:transcriptional regulator of aroF, aroG, tyrA and aromatic amino acid transport
MRIHVSFIDRVGITQEVLALLGGRNLNLDAVEMVPPNVYIDAPTLSAEVLEELRGALLQVHGVQSVEVVDILPGQRRRLQLDALLAAMPDPVLAVDDRATVLLANPALVDMCNRPPEGLSIAALFADDALQQSLLAAGFHQPLREVHFAGQPLLLDAQPITEDGRLTGGLLTLYAPSRMGQRLAALHHDHAEGFDSLLGESAPIRALKARALRVASLDAPLLIHGETGTGKELVARACHTVSVRRTAPFLALNCAALPENLAESELFGYAPGAFTGAQRGGKPGLLELANQGTVFLDEIGEMSPYLQAKLLRFLSDGSFRRVGGDREVKVDVRILSATHRDLEKMVAEGSFREDLFYRLNVVPIVLPPLRDRQEDVLWLMNLFLRRIAAASGQVPPKLTSSVEVMALQHNWPGNVRELRNRVERAAALAVGIISPADLFPDLLDRGDDVSSLAGMRDLAERQHIRRVLEQTQGNVPEAALRLGVSRSTLFEKMRRLGLTRSSG